MSHPNPRASEMLSRNSDLPQQQLARETAQQTKPCCGRCQHSPGGSSRRTQLEADCIASGRSFKCIAAVRAGPVSLAASAASGIWGGCLITFTGCWVQRQDLPR